jgi:hypothetical protein
LGSFVEVLSFAVSESVEELLLNGADTNAKSRNTTTNFCHVFRDRNLAQIAFSLSITKG